MRKQKHRKYNFLKVSQLVNWGGRYWSLATCPNRLHRAGSSVFCPHRPELGRFPVLWITRTKGNLPLSTSLATPSLSSHYILFSLINGPCQVPWTQLWLKILCLRTRACFTSQQSMQLHEVPHIEGPPCLIECYPIMVWKVLTMLSLHMCFLSEIQRSKGS